ncbi:cytochrome P450 [Nemania sp. FL0031]|nr:cytochrome P450 [Nemania sp. FL0031]
MQSILRNYHCLGAAILGGLSHVAVFIRGEWHMEGPLLTRIYSGLIITVLYAEYCYHHDFVTAILAASSITASYLAGLFISIAIYRKYFHRLRHFPGPSVAAVTKFWHVWKCSRDDNYLLLEELSKKYGPIIRTGPEELTVIDPVVFSVIDGPKSQCTKAAWYDIFLPQVALNTTRSAGDHASRRRIWDRGFGPAALACYEERIAEYADLLVARIEGLVSRGRLADSHEYVTVNVTEWFSWFAFDVMGEFAFAKSFGMLQDGKWHTKVRLLIEAMSMLGPVSPVPWLAQLMLNVKPRLPLVKDWFAMLQWCKECMDERLQKNVKRLDVSHWLIEALNKDLQTSDMAWLNGDAVTIIVAGSGTVAVALTFAFYELAKSPAQQDRLYREVVNVDIRDRIQLQNCTHLNAIIQETLRLYPPVPTGGYRVTPPSGVFVNDTHIPGNTTIVAPKYSIARLETSYENANKFIPERWTTQQEMVKDKRGFSPFSQGKFGCVGKSLAMSEMRIVIALLVKRFEISFGDDGKGESLFTGLRDQFTFAPGDLQLRFSIRA